jgi:IclR family acetate operon transcriptional repressor
VENSDLRLEDTSAHPNGHANGNGAAMAGAERQRARSSVQSVDRALLLLETIAEMGGESSLSHLAARTGLNISTCHHLLATLLNWGYIAKVPGRRSYALGARTLYLGQACLKHVDLPRRAQPHIESVNAATGETVHLAVMQGDAVVTLIKCEARHAVRVDTGSIGRSDSAYATATGKAMLAWLPEDEIRRIVGPSMPAFTANTITDFSTLIEELRLVRRNGFATDREEFQPGVICIGAAIRNHSGAVVGAISASTPTMRADEAHLRDMREQVVKATRALSAELGETGADAAMREEDNRAVV